MCACVCGFARELIFICVFALCKHVFLLIKFRVADLGEKELLGQTKTAKAKVEAQEHYKSVGRQQKERDGASRVSVVPLYMVINMSSGEKTKQI